MPSDIDVVVTHSKQIEQLLEQKFAAKGRGLHEKVDSVTHVLDPALIKRLRWIATMRNKVVHEDFNLPSQDDFISSCQSALHLIQTTSSSAIPPFNQPITHRSNARVATQQKRRNYRRQSNKQSSSMQWIIGVMIIGVLLMIFGALK